MRYLKRRRRRDDSGMGMITLLYWRCETARILPSAGHNFSSFSPLAERGDFPYNRIIVKGISGDRFVNFGGKDCRKVEQAWRRIGPSNEERGRCSFVGKRGTVALLRRIMADGSEGNS